MNLMMKNELVSVTRLGEKYFGAPLKGRDMNKVLCEAGFQTKRVGKRGYTVTEKGERFSFKIEPGKYYWYPSVLDELQKVK